MHKTGSNCGFRCDYCSTYYPNKRALIIHEYIHIDQDVNTLLSFLEQSDESNCLPAAQKSLPNELQNIRISKMNWKKENQGSETYRGVSKTHQLSEAIDEMIYLTKKYPLKRHTAKIPEKQESPCTTNTNLECEDALFERRSVLTTNYKKRKVFRNSGTYFTSSNKSLIKTEDSSVSDTYTAKCNKNPSSVGYAFEKKDNDGPLADYANCQRLETILPKFNRSFDSAYDSLPEEGEDDVEVDHAKQVRNSEASSMKLINKFISLSIFDNLKLTDTSDCGKSRTPKTVNYDSYEMVDSNFQKQFIPDVSKPAFLHYEKNSESIYLNCTSQERNFNLHGRKLVGKV